MPTEGPNSIVQFGVFEVDLQAHELRKSGMKIKIQEQPFQVLVLLLEHRDSVLSREELRSRLWPNGTFVDFEHGLNAAVKRLRDALGDDAENPRFIETVLEKVLDRKTVDPDALLCYFETVAPDGRLLLACPLARGDIYALDLDFR